MHGGMRNSRKRPLRTWTTHSSSNADANENNFGGFQTLRGADEAWRYAGTKKALPPGDDIASPKVDGITSFGENWNHVAIDKSRIEVAAGSTESISGISAIVQTDDDVPPFTAISEPPIIAYNCLLIPVGIAFWWYWTKRAARNALKEVLPPAASDEPSSSENPCHVDYQCHAPEDDDDGAEGNFVTSTPHVDQFRSWEDVVGQDPPDRSLRLVRWLRGKHSNAKRRISNVTKRVGRSRKSNRNSLKGADIGDDDETNNRETPMLAAVAGDDDDDDDGDSFTVTSTMAPPAVSGTSLHWQCIEDMTGFELCELKSPGSSDSDMPLNRHDHDFTGRETDERRREAVGALC